MYIDDMDIISRKVSGKKIHIYRVYYFGKVHEKSMCNLSQSKWWDEEDKIDSVTHLVSILKERDMCLRCAENLIRWSKTTRLALIDKI